VFAFPKIVFRHKTIVFFLTYVIAFNVVHAQDVYLRLTDYAGGKIGLVAKPFQVQEISYDVITTIRNIEVIIKNDLEYSLYFDVVTDTADLEDAEQGVVLAGTGNKTQLTITLDDFASHEQIATRVYPVSKNIREVAHTISNDIVEILTGEKGIALTKIVFSYKTSSGKELAMIDYDGFNFTRLTNNGRYNLFPAWAPDTRRLLFSSHTKDRLNLYLFDLLKRDITTISSFRGLNFAPCWSPDATKICMSLTKDGNAEIYLLDLNTEKLHRLTNNRAIDTSPAFSPNSREVTFVSDRSGNPQIYVMDMYGGNVRRLTFHGNYNTSPAWSPRGDIIAYVSREKDNSQQIYVTDPYDFSPVRLTSEGNNEEPCFSPDGLHIVFSSNRTGRYQLYTMNWDGSRVRKLTDGITANAPDWSPVTE
jgi:TolB protein